MNFTPSSYQQRIFSFVQNEQGDGIVNAVAGSGKTTTLIQAARLLKTGSALFVAFNKHVALALKAQLAGTRMVASTVHSIGYRCLANALEAPQLDETKYKTLTRDWILNNVFELKQAQVADLLDSLSKLVRMVQVTLADPKDDAQLSEIVKRFTIDLDPKYFDAVNAILRKGKIAASKEKRISFDDMIWLPAEWALKPAKASWVFIDEAQDLNAASVDLIGKMRAPDGRMLFVGDPHQAIYAFSGADAESFHNLKSKFRATELPLSICYRCPTTHLDFARRLVPEIQARPDAPPGVLMDLTKTSFFKELRPGDLVLGRKTSPLVTLCIQLIQRGTAARVRGRDIGKDLVFLARRIARLIGFYFAEFAVFVQIYRQRQVQYLTQREDSASQLQSLHDRCDALLACYDAFETSSFDQYCREVEALFSDERPAVWLSTVHRAKGLEENRVFIIEPDDLPLTWIGQQAWEAEQEQNLYYVALTRSKHALYFVYDDEPTDEPLNS